MSLTYAILACFKDKGVDYLYLKEQGVSKIPCLHCSQTIEICMKTSSWTCNHCEESGTLKHYITGLTNGVTDTKVYHPKREKKAIMNSLCRLMNKATSKNTEDALKRLRIRFETLIEYYEDKVSK